MFCSFSTTSIPRPSWMFLFVNLFDFDKEYALARVEELLPDAPVRLARLATLVKMKLDANRPKDREDVENLKLIYGENFEG